MDDLRTHCRARQGLKERLAELADRKRGCGRCFHLANPGQHALRLIVGDASMSRIRAIGSGITKAMPITSHPTKDCSLILKVRSLALVSILHIPAIGCGFEPSAARFAARHYHISRRIVHLTAPALAAGAAQGG